VFCCNDKRLAEYPPQARFYLAEAFQRRGDKGDEQLALAAYQATTNTIPGFAPSYRALGMYHMKKKEFGKAEGYFAKYMQLAPNAPDLDYVKNYHAQSKRGGTK
jgi:beta-barrel assembly-enhancing protease